MCADALCAQGATTLLLRKRGFFDAPFEHASGWPTQRPPLLPLLPPYLPPTTAPTPITTTHLIPRTTHNHLSLRQSHHTSTRLTARNPIPAPIAVSYDVHTLYLARAPRACLLSVVFLLATYFCVFFVCFFFVVACTRVSLLRFPHYHPTPPPPPPTTLYRCFWICTDLIDIRYPMLVFFLCVFGCGLVMVLKDGLDARLTARLF